MEDCRRRAAAAVRGFYSDYLPGIPLRCGEPGKKSHTRLRVIRYLNLGKYLSSPLKGGFL